MIDPFEQLRDWLPENDDSVRPPMTLSTLGADGYPDARTVLLSALDECGALFHTDARSRKAAQLAENPRACAVIVLGERERQITLVGDVEPLDPEALALAYRRRTRYLQVLAWINTDALAAQLPDVRRRSWQEFEDGHPGELEPPLTWAGYRLKPHRIKFWTADAVGPSTRIEYRREAGSWATRVLAG